MFSSGGILKLHSYFRFEGGGGRGGGEGGGEEGVEEGEEGGGGGEREREKRG